MTTPLYYKFVFNGEDATVILAHNHEDHPAHVRTHEDLKKEYGEGLHHGYAYRIGNGWRITTEDHKPLEDKFIITQVVRAIRAKEGAKAHHQSKQAEGFDWDRTHYGQPMLRSSE